MALSHFMARTALCISYMAHANRGIFGSCSSTRALLDFLAQLSQARTRR